LNKIWITVSTVPVFLLSLIIPTNLDIYGSEEYNESLALKQYNETLAYKYGDTAERSKMEIEHLLKECEQPSALGLPGMKTIYIEDKCKPVIEFYKGLGWEITRIGESIQDSEKDTITFTIASLAIGTCLLERFEMHVLLSGLDECQKTIEYYLANGYNLVEKTDKGVELVQRPGNETGAIGNK
jgi:hypothetical protein